MAKRAHLSLALAAMALGAVNAQTLMMTKKGGYASTPEDPLEIIVAKPSAQVGRVLDRYEEVIEPNYQAWDARLMSLVVVTVTCHVRPSVPWSGMFLHDHACTIASGNAVAQSRDKQMKPIQKPTSHAQSLAKQETIPTAPAFLRVLRPLCTDHRRRENLKITVAFRSRSLWDLTRKNGVPRAALKYTRCSMIWQRHAMLWSPVMKRFSCCCVFPRRVYRSYGTSSRRHLDDDGKHYSTRSVSSLSLYPDLRDFE